MRETPKPFQKNILAALRAWHAPHGHPENLLSHLKLVQKKQSERQQDDSGVLGREATSRILWEGIEELSLHNEEGGRILTQRFIDGHTTAETALLLSLSDDQLKQRQRKAVHQLADIIWMREMAYGYRLRERITAELPTFNRDLVGIDDLSQELMEIALHGTERYLINVVGLGGLGKTSLILHTAYQLVEKDHFSHIIWLQIENNRPTIGETLHQKLLTKIEHTLGLDKDPSASRIQQERFIRHVLDQNKVLLVIDNIEHKNQLEILIPLLNQLIKPTKVILGSRIQVVDQTVDMYTLKVPPLRAVAACTLIRQRATHLGIDELGTISDDLLTPIYKAVGGNPLALRLIVGLSQVWSLEQIIKDLEEVHSDDVRGLYQHIYWQAWHAISPHAQTVLSAMPIASGRGVVLEQLQACVPLTAAEFIPAIQELSDYSLLDITGTIHERRYSIHRLTESFLRTSIIHWPEDEFIEPLV